jgi:ubiquinone/menaquinone biosynthesis C-methylase UbiE
MGTPWDRAAAGYLEEWVPRFVPYHLDLVRELTLRDGDRVLVTSAGPGTEVLAVARAVGTSGFVRATDKSPEMVRICQEQVERAHLEAQVETAEADASDAHGGPWDSVVCAFGLWQLGSRTEALQAWRKELAPRGKVGIITWGPSDVAGPFELLKESLHELEPELDLPTPYVLAERDAMSRMFDEGSLEMLRHTVVRHTITFQSAEAFVRAMSESCTWRRIWEELGDARIARIATRFYERVGGPAAPLSFDPTATIAIAGIPGADIELAHRPSVKL